MVRALVYRLTNQFVFLTFYFRWFSFNKHIDGMHLYHDRKPHWNWTEYRITVHKNASKNMYAISVCINEKCSTQTGYVHHSMFWIIGNEWQGGCREIGRLRRKNTTYIYNFDFSKSEAATYTLHRVGKEKLWCNERRKRMKKIKESDDSTHKSRTTRRCEQEEKKKKKKKNWATIERQFGTKKLKIAILCTQTRTHQLFAEDYVHAKSRGREWERHRETR